MKLKLIIYGLLYTIFIAVLWVIFLRVTLLGVMLWYAPPQFAIAALLSLLIPLIFFSLFVIRKINNNRLFLYISLCVAIGLLVFAQGPAECAPPELECVAIGILILPIIFGLYFLLKRNQ